MHEDDWKARAVLDALADIPRCPECGVVSNSEWRRLDHQMVGLCTTVVATCDVVYFRQDGKRLYVGSNQAADGTWIWSNGPRG